MLETPASAAYSATNLGYLDSGSASGATGISNGGTVVGWSDTNGGVSPSCVHLHGRSDDRSEHPAPSLNGWTLEYATGISSDGTISSAMARMDRGKTMRSC